MSTYFNVVRLFKTEELSVEKNTKMISRSQKSLGFLSILLCGLGLVNEKTLANEILDAGGGMTCAIQADNTMACWGSGAISPSGTFSQVSVGGRACGILADSSIIVCWGGGKKIIPPEGTFSQVSVGSNHACGLRTDDTVACWGENDYGQTTPPQGSFSQVSAANNFTCGIQMDGTLACWGSYGLYGVSHLPLNKVPAGTFSLINAGSAHICGIRTDNSLVCWGWLPHILEVKNGSFMVDGKVYKWGNGVFDEEVFKDGNIIDDGRATPPWREGTFYQVEGGNFVSCWLRSDQAVVCMGPNDPPSFEGLRPPGSRCECVFPYPWSGLAICQCECNFSISHCPTIARWRMRSGRGGILPFCSIRSAR